MAGTLLKALKVIFLLDHWVICVGQKFLRPSRTTTSPALPSPPINPVPRCHIHRSLKHLQGWWLHHHPGHPIPKPDNPSHEEISPNIQSKPQNIRSIQKGQKDVISYLFQKCRLAADWWGLSSNKCQKKPEGVQTLCTLERCLLMYFPHIFKLYVVLAQIPLTALSHCYFLQFSHQSNVHLSSSSSILQINF